VIHTAMKKNGDIAAIISILMLCVGLSSYYTQTGMGWYHQSIIKPALTPPDWVFTIVWGVIFISTSIAAFLLSRLYRHTAAWRSIAMLFIIAAGLTAAWSYLFFHHHSMQLALVDAIILQLTVLLAISLTWNSAREIALLLLPFALWLCMALYLNYQVMILNPGP
jgi:translocator protein